jgi:hypothetical protein
LLRKHLVARQDQLWWVIHFHCLAIQHIF